MSSDQDLQGQSLERREDLSAVSSVSELVGRTPLVRLRNIGEPDGAPIYVKMENVNPSGSMRDRYIAEILEKAFHAGHLVRGDHLALAGLDDSAVAAALLGGLLGFDVHIFAPQAASPRLLPLITRYGATVEWVEESTKLEDAIARAAAWAREKSDRMYVDGFRRDAVRESYEIIAREIIEALQDRILGAFVTSVTTGGTFRWVSQKLRQTHPNLLVGGAVLIDADFSDLGAGENNVLSRYDIEQAWQWRDRISEAEGLLLGPKGAACVALAVELQESLPTEHAIVALNPDSGQRYLGWENRSLFTHQYVALKIPGKAGS